MTIKEQLHYLIDYLIQENPAYADIEIPRTIEGQQHLLRSLMNVRAPKPISHDFLEVQDAYLKAQTAAKGVTCLEDLTPVQPGIYLWQGDITTLKVDGIVNAANSGMVGCFVPCHGCIDNAIHSASGIQLRLACARIMDAQNGPEPTGQAKITKAYNLPCRYVLHTVGPIVNGRVLPENREALANCYQACLELAAAKQLKSLAFCCISTGEFHFPNQEAATIAVKTVKSWQAAHPNGLEVIFNVFKDQDKAIYEQLLG